MSLKAQILVDYGYGGCMRMAVGTAATASSNIRFVSSPATPPGTYSFTLYNGTSPSVASMSVGSGGIITGTSHTGINGVIPGIGFTWVLSSSSFEVVRGNYGAGYWGGFVPNTPPICSPGSIGGLGWSCWTLLHDTEYPELTIPNCTWGAITAGCNVLGPHKLSVESYIIAGGDTVGCGAYDYKPAIPAESGVATYTLYASGAVIPDEDKPQQPVTVTNPTGNTTPVMVCFQVEGRIICFGDLDPGETGEYTIPVLTPGAEIIPILTPNPCNMCEPIYGEPIVFIPTDNPYIGPVVSIFIPYIPPQPDPNPDPDPEPTGGGNEYNFQGCVKNPCEIPYLYKFQSKP